MEKTGTQSIDLKIRWKQQDVDGSKSIIHFLRNALLMEEGKCNRLIDELKELRERT